VDLQIQNGVLPVPQFKVTEFLLEAFDFPIPEMCSGRHIRAALESATS